MLYGKIGCSPSYPKRVISATDDLPMQWNPPSEIAKVAVLNRQVSHRERQRQQMLCPGTSFLLLFTQYVTSDISALVFDDLQKHQCSCVLVSISCPKDCAMDSADQKLRH